MKSILLFTVFILMVLTSYSQVVYIIESDVNLRKGPDNSAKILRTVAHDEVITVLGKTNQWWWNVQYKGTTGYIARSFITVSYPLTVLAYIKTYPEAFGIGFAILILLILIRGVRKNKKPKSKKGSNKPKAKSKKKAGK